MKQAEPWLAPSIALTAIAAAVRWLFTAAKIVAEPSGAATVAAAFLDPSPYEGPVVAIVSGGNLDPADLSKYL